VRGLVRMYGTLTPALTPRTLVELQVQTTGPFGGVAFTLAPTATARYELVYKGNAVYAPTHSGIVTIKVYVIV